MNKHLSLITASALCAALAGCGAGDGQGLDENGNPILDTPTQGNGGGNQGGSGGNAGTVTLAELQADIFGNICSVCHAGGGAPAGLRLDSEDNSFNFLVDVDANEIPSLKRVAPGDPENSYLVHKIEGRPGIVGGQMPLGMEPLSSEDIQRIKDWIANGAPRTGTGSASTKVTASNLQKSNSHFDIHLHFSRSLDASSLDAEDFTLIAHYPFYNEQLTPEQFSINADKQRVTLSIHEQTIYTAEQLELRVQDPRFSTIYDADGRMIDGDNDETEGGATRYVFTL